MCGLHLWLAILVYDKDQLHERILDWLYLMVICFTLVTNFKNTKKNFSEVLSRWNLNHCLLPKINGHNTNRSSYSVSLRIKIF